MHACTDKELADHLTDTIAGTRCHMTLHLKWCTYAGNFVQNVTCESLALPDAVRDGVALLADVDAYDRDIAYDR